MPQRLSDERLAFLCEGGGAFITFKVDEIESIARELQQRRAEPATVDRNAVIEELKDEQIASLVKAADYLTDEWSEGSGEHFDTLLSLGLIAAVEGGYDPENHVLSDWSDDLEPGDPYYKIAPWLLGAINRLRPALKDTP